MAIANLYQPDVALKVGELYLAENPLPQILIWILKERDNYCVEQTDIKDTYLSKA